MSNEKGFTLLEVVIAVFILALMSMMMWQITNNAYRGSEKAGLYDDIYQSGRVALRKMCDDFSMAFILGTGLRGGFVGGIGVGHASFSGGTDGANFVSFSNIRYVKNEKKADYAEVGYFIAECPDSEEKRIQCLMRRESSDIDDKLEEGGEVFPVAKGIKKMALKYYDINKKEWRDDWKAVDPALASMLPFAVKISLAFQDPKDEREEILFETAVTIAMWAAPMDF